MLLDARRKLELDMWYIRNRSLALDLKIIARTPALLILGEQTVEEERLERPRIPPPGRGQLR